MRTHRRRGFTLIEVLIVVALVAVLAATVIPQFASSTEDAKRSALEHNLRLLRSQVQAYEAQHFGDYPEIRSGALPQLTGATNMYGELGTPGDEHPYGPYLDGALPVNPFDQSNQVTRVAVAGHFSKGSLVWWVKFRVQRARTREPYAGDQMTAVESITRLLLGSFLIWCLFARHPRWNTWMRHSAVLGMAAFGFGLLAEIKGQSWEGYAAAALLGAASLLLYGRKTRERTPLAAAPWPLVAVTVGFFAGQGAVVAAVVLTLAFCLLEARHETTGRFGGHSRPGASVLRIRAQSIRGVIGRVEGVLERMQVKPSHMAVDHTSKDKELTIVAEFTPPAGLELKDLIAALQEIEGVIQFALE